MLASLNFVWVQRRLQHMDGVEFGVGHPVDVTHDLRSVDYSSTGEYILSASTDGTLKMWDTAEEGGATQSYFDEGTSTWVKVRKYSRPPALNPKP
jgi:WD40 repeat protein